MLESLPLRRPLRRKTAHWLAAAGDALASVLLPAGCRICETLLVRASRLPICDQCLNSFPPMPQRICELCGQALESWPSDAEESILCPNCHPPRFAFERARSLTIYDETAVSAILILKYERLEPLARWFARRLAELARSQGQGFAADIVVPVPLHRARERERGYNQAALLAKPLARELRLPYRPVLLQRIRERPTGRILSVEERWEAVRGAFATRPGSQVDNLRVLLVDDVMTTGATLDACARALLAGGAQSVVGLTVARAARIPVTKSVPGPSPSKPEERA
jgi:ComF family protein